MENKNFIYKQIDVILLGNINYIPEKERENIINKIIGVFPNDKIKSINWLYIIKVFRSIIEKNKNSSLCQSVFCVNYIKKVLDEK